MKPYRKIGRLSLGAALVFTQLLAIGATAQVLLQSKQQESYSFNAASCELDAEEVAFQYELNLQGTQEQYAWAVYLQQPGSECPELMIQDPVFVIREFGGFETLSDANRFLPVLESDRSVSPRELVGTDICAGVRSEYQLCLYLSTREKENEDTVILQQFIVAPTVRSLVSVDTSFPGVPMLAEPSPLNNAVELEIENEEAITDADEVVTYLIQYRPCTTGDDNFGSALDDAGTTVDDIESSCSSPFGYTEVEQDNLLLDGLVNGIDYEVRVSLLDDFENQGGFSQPQTVTADSGFTPGGLYNGSGNGGVSCAQGLGTSALSFLILCALMLLGRRKSSSGTEGAKRSLLLLVAPVVFASSASAYPGQWNAEVKLTPFVPAIDLEPAATGEGTIYPIYSCFFQNKGSFPPFGIFPLPQIGLDFHLFDDFGSFEAGVGIAPMQVRGSAFSRTDANSNAVASGSCGEPGDASVELSMLYVKPRLSYRLDQLHDYFGIPLAPYVRGALVAGGYVFTQDGQLERKADALGDPFGFRLGYEASAGLMVGVSWVDLLTWWSIVTSVKEIWRTGEIPRPRPKSRAENMYLFVEGSYSRVDNFHQPGLQIGPRDVLFGTDLPVTMSIGFAVELR